MQRAVDSLRSRYQRRWLKLLSDWRDEDVPPIQVALGFALGTFIGIFPSFAVGSLIALYTAGKFGWSQMAALSGAFLMNPLTAPLFYSMSYVVGARIAGDGTRASDAGLVDCLQKLGWAYLAGIFTVALAAAVVTGCIGYAVASQRRLSRKSRTAAVLAPEHPHQSG